MDGRGRGPSDPESDLESVHTLTRIFIQRLSLSVCHCLAKGHDGTDFMTIGQKKETMPAGRLELVLVDSRCSVSRIYFIYTYFAQSTPLHSLPIADPEGLPGWAADQMSTHTVVWPLGEGQILKKGGRHSSWVR